MDTNQQIAALEAELKQEIADREASDPVLQKQRKIAELKKKALDDAYKSEVEAHRANVAAFEARRGELEALDVEAFNLIDNLYKLVVKRIEVRRDLRAAHASVASEAKRLVQPIPDKIDGDLFGAFSAPNPREYLTVFLSRYFERLPRNGEVMDWARVRVSTLRGG